MKNKERELLKNTTIVSLGKICTQLITFLLLPLYTALLSTSEYGIVDLLNTLVALFLPILCLQLDQGVFRFLIDYRKDEYNQKKIISTVFSIILFQISLFILLFICVQGYINNEYKYYLVFILIANLLSSMLLQVARGLGDNYRYSLGSFLAGSTTVVLNVVFIACLKWGAIGMLLATFLGHVICSLYIVISMRLHKMIDIKSIDKTISKDVLKYSIPLIPNIISWWVINASDRLIISHFLGIGVNGIYSIGTKFPSIITTLYSVFNLTWTESASLYIESEDASDFFSRIFDIILRIFSSICLCAINFMPFVFPILIHHQYHEAYNQIPILIIGVLFNIFVSFLGSIYVAKKLTKEIAKTSIIAAVINMIVNLLFIKHIGLYAASISTALSYFAMFVYRYIDSKKYIQLYVNKYIVYLICILFILSMMIYYVNKMMLSIIWALITIMILLMLNKKSIVFILELLKNKIKS